MQRQCSYSDDDKLKILDGRGYPPQRFCALCGRTNLPIEMAHMLPKSIGGKACAEHGESPRLPLCKRCHGAHDSYLWKPVWEEGQWLASVFDEDFAYSLGFARRWDSDRFWLTFDDGTGPDTMPDYSEDDVREMDELLTLAGRSDYLIGCKLSELDKRMNRKDLAEWLCEHFAFKPRSVGSYITKRLAYGRLKGDGIETLGVTRGYLVAQLVAAGHPCERVLSDMQTMPRAQFDEQYGIGRSPKRRVCPHCGVEL